MKKHIFTILLLVFGLFLLASCNPDKASEKDLVGTWRNTSGEYAYEMELSADGQCTYRSYHNGNLFDTSYYVWYVKGDNLVMDIESYPYKLSGDTLTWGGMVYKRK